MQISKLLIPRCGTDNYGNFQNCFDFLQIDYKTQNQIDNAITNNNYDLSPVRYQSDLEIDDKYITSISDLHNNDRKILYLLNEEMWSVYSFKALERKLNIHQQSLTRALKRLLDLGFIKKTSAGYMLIEKSISLPDITTEESILNEATNSGKIKKIRRFNQLIQFNMPFKNNIKSMVSLLIGKWFGNLRWLGMIKKETGFRLQWMVVDKVSNNRLFQINLNIVSEYIILESDAISDSEKVEAMSYSNRLVGEIINILKGNLQEEYLQKKVYTPFHTLNAKYNINKNK